MHADFLEPEQPVQEAHVPIGRAARADMAQHARVSSREMLGSDRRHRAGAHLGDRGRVDEGDRHAGARIEEIEQRHLRGQAALVVVDIVADDLHAREAHRRHIAAQHVEMAAEGRVGLQMHARLDHRLAETLRAQSRLDGGEDLLVGQREALDIRPVEVREVDLASGHLGLLPRL